MTLCWLRSSMIPLSEVNWISFLQNQNWHPCWPCDLKAVEGKPDQVCFVGVLLLWGVFKRIWREKDFKVLLTSSCNLTKQTCSGNQITWTNVVLDRVRSNLISLGLNIQVPCKLLCLCITWFKDSRESSIIKASVSLT